MARWNIDAAIYRVKLQSVAELALRSLGVDHRISVVLRVFDDDDRAKLLAALGAMLKEAA